MCMKVLLACEESQTITKEFRKRGHQAFSCDLKECSGGHPEWHIRDDVFNHLDRSWDLMIAHPDCTYLASSGVQWLSHPDDRDLPFEDRRPHPKFPERRSKMEAAVQFVKDLYNAPIPKIAIENPQGLLSSRWRKPDQYVHPYHFGEPFSKKTGWWLKNLPPLVPTNIVDKGERTVFKSGKSHPKWYADILATAKTDEERRRMRSKTFQGMAAAIADQWGNPIDRFEAWT